MELSKFILKQKSITYTRLIINMQTYICDTPSDFITWDIRKFKPDVFILFLALSKFLVVLVLRFQQMILDISTLS